MSFSLINLGPLGLYKEIYNIRACARDSYIYPTPLRIQII
jgi:hypothetical protein